MDQVDHCSQQINSLVQKHDKSYNPTRRALLRKLVKEGLVSESSTTREIRRQDEMIAVLKAVQRVKGKAEATRVLESRLEEFSKPEAQTAFDVVRMIILLGWLLYPIGYMIVGFLNARDELREEELLNRRTAVVLSEKRSC